MPRLRYLLYLLAALAGVLAFLGPFLWPANAPDSLRSPLALTVLLGLAFLALLLEAQSQVRGAQTLALLGTLVALNAALRFVETVIPGPGGFSPVFFLILLVGYVFGARLGFLMGALTLFVSALLTGGVGPWLPAQMFAAGWVGM
ncbi:MAG: ECF transporter S component, partial [Deltaproteobacteria bacterium]